MLLALDEVRASSALDLPGFGLHRMRGNMADDWWIVVSAKWRITFRFDGENVVDVDFLDYH